MSVILCVGIQYIQSNARAQNISFFEISLQSDMRRTCIYIFDIFDIACMQIFHILLPLTIIVIVPNTFASYYQYNASD